MGRPSFNGSKRGFFPTLMTLPHTLVLLAFLIALSAASFVLYVIVAVLARGL